MNLKSFQKILICSAINCFIMSTVNASISDEAPYCKGGCVSSRRSGLILSALIFSNALAPNANSFSFLPKVNNNFRPLNSTPLNDLNLPQFNKIDQDNTNSLVFQRELSRFDKFSAWGWTVLKKHHLNKSQVSRVETLVSLVQRVLWIFPPLKNFLDTALKGSIEVSEAVDSLEKLEDSWVVYKDLKSQKFPRSVEDFKKFSADLVALANDLADIAEDIKKIEKYI